MSQRLRILICDDAADQRLLAASALRRAFADECDLLLEECADGESAVARIIQGGVDLMLLDFHMPRLDGIGVLKERARLNLDVPVVFVTSHSDREVLIEAMKLGASDFIAKDEFSAARLPQVVRSSLERARLRSDVSRAEKMAAIGTLAGGVAHEFNNILQVILGNAQYALNRDDPARWKQALEASLEASEKGARIVRQLLSFARTRQSAQVKFRLEQAVTESLAMESEAARRDGIEVILTINRTPCVLGDSGQIVQIMQNLLTNARHACLQAASRSKGYRGRVSVTLDANPEYAQVSVSDNGVGISPGSMKKLFEPFFTTKGSLGGQVFDGKASGTGLGLSISQRIAAEHDGRIDVSSTPNEGSTFTLLLPSVAESSSGDTRKRLKEQDNLKTTALVDKSIQGQSILVLEDEPLIAGLLASYLTDRGLRCDVALDVERARELAGGTAYGLMLFDLTMAGETGGLELLREIRRSGGPNAGGKAMAMTGHAVTEGDGELLQAGFRGVVHKPFSMSDMGKLVTEALRS